MPYSYMRQMFSSFRADDDIVNIALAEENKIRSLIRKLETENA